MLAKDLDDGDMFRVSISNWTNVYVKIDENTVICIDPEAFGITYPPSSFNLDVVKLGSLPHLITELKRALK